jgi:hypothetical protein
MVKNLLLALPFCCILVVDYTLLAAANQIGNRDGIRLMGCKLLIAIPVCIKWLTCSQWFTSHVWPTIQFEKVQVSS